MNPPKANDKVGLDVKETGGGSSGSQEEASDCQCRREEGRTEDWVGGIPDCSAVQVSSACLLLGNLFMLPEYVLFRIILTNRYVSNVSPSSFLLLVSLFCLCFGILGVVINLG